LAELNTSITPFSFRWREQH